MRHTWKWFLVAALLFCLFWSTEATAEVAGGAFGDNLTWALDDNGVLTIDGTGAMPDYSWGNNPPWYDYRNTATSVIINGGVTSIGNYAFHFCESLSGITIPNGMTSIGESAFNYCTSLSGITIPSSVTSIGTVAFNGCTSLMNVIVDDGNDVYCDIDGVLYNNDQTALILYPANRNDLTFSIPDSVTGIECNAFSYANLSAITIPDSVTAIGAYAFSCCVDLSDITIPDGVTSLDDYVFQSCPSLSSITIPDSVTSIGWYVFSNCTGLADITIPSSVTSIGTGAFNNCTDLTDVYFTGSESEWNAIAIGGENNALTGAHIHYNSISAVIVASGTCGDGVTWTLDSLGTLTISGTGAMDDFSADDTETAWKPHDQEIVTVTIEPGVTSIGNYAFSYSSLNSIIIPDSVTSIGNFAFVCTSLSSITIPAGVTSIGEFPFLGCYGLGSIFVAPDNPAYQRVNGFLLTRDGTRFLWCSPKQVGSVTIPDGVTSIAGGAFSLCERLNAITVPASVTSIEGYVFGDCASLFDIYFGGTQVQWDALGISLYEEITLHVATVPTIVAGGDCGDSVTWTLDDKGNLLISGDGDMWEFNYGASPWADCLGSIRSVTVQYGVTSVGSCAFLNCANLTSARLSDSVAFISYYAFCNCTSLEYISLPASVTSMYEYVFSGCSSLTAIYVDWYNPSYKEEDGLLLSRGGTVLYWCSPTRTGSVTVPEGVEYIYFSAFADCTGLTGVTMPSTVTNILDGAFVNCTGLTSVTIPPSVTGIGDFAFANCTGLTSLTIPASVTYFGSMPFGTCYNLASITVAPDNPHFSSVDGVLLIEDGRSLLWCSPTVSGSVTVPDGITCIDHGAFDGCNKITDVTFPASVTSILSVVFTRCDSMSDIYYNGSAQQWQAIEIRTEDIDRFTLHFVPDTANMNILYLPPSLTAIESEAFADLMSVDAIRIPASVVSIDEHAFDRSGVALIVPAGSAFIQWAMDLGITCYTD